MRLGILGGTFNPIHFGHLDIAHKVREKLQLDQILFVPAGNPPHKQGETLAAGNDRYEMVRLAIAGNSCFALSDIELRRKGKSYSIDTVRHLQGEYGPSAELSFLIGLDAFLDFPTWKEPQALLQACRFVVISRPGQSFQSLASLPLFPQTDPRALAQLDAGTLTSLKVTVPSGPGILCLPLRPCSISASEIRQRIRRGEALAKLLPPSVESYILRHRLYQEDRDHTHI